MEVSSGSTLEGDLGGLGVVLLGIALAVSMAVVLDLTELLLIDLVIILPVFLGV